MNYTWGIYIACALLFIAGLCLLKGGNGRLAEARAVSAAGKAVKEKGGLLKSRITGTKAYKERERRIIDREIYEGLSMLRNMVSIGNAKDRSADAAVSMLAEKEGVLQPVYINFLRLLRLDRREEAAEAFFQGVDTPMGREFGGFLLKWDEIAPTELIEILISHQKTIKEAVKTEQKRIDETVSDLIYLPVVVNVMAVFLNFIYTAYFMQQREILSLMF